MTQWAISYTCACISSVAISICMSVSSSIFISIHSRELYLVHHNVIAKQMLLQLAWGFTVRSSACVAWGMTHWALSCPCAFILSLCTPASFFHLVNFIWVILCKKNGHLPILPLAVAYDYHKRTYYLITWSEMDPFNSKQNIFAVI